MNGEIPEGQCLLFGPPCVSPVFRLFSDDTDRVYFSGLEPEYRKFFGVPLNRFAA